VAFTHGKSAFISINSGGANLTAYTNNIDYTHSADEHDVTTFGQTGHVRQGGLTDGSLVLTGVYDNSTAAPHDKIIPLLGTVCSVTYRPEGTGSGLPEHTGNILVQSYQESVPVADMISWTATFPLSGAMTVTNQ
jgi:hypothetical protein